MRKTKPQTSHPNKHHPSMKGRYKTPYVCAQKVKNNEAHQIKLDNEKTKRS